MVRVTAPSNNHTNIITPPSNKTVQIRHNKGLITAILISSYLSLARQRHPPAMNIQIINILDVTSEVNFANLLLNRLLRTTKNALNQTNYYTL
jgi:hypothetical protein